MTFHSHLTQSQIFLVGKAFFSLFAQPLFYPTKLISSQISVEAVRADAVSRGPGGQGLQVLPPRVHPESNPEDQNSSRRDQSLSGPGRVRKDSN